MNEGRLDFCKRVMGVEHTIKLGDSVEKDLRDVTDGHLPDVVIDATGSSGVDVGRVRLRRPRRRPAGLRRDHDRRGQVPAPGLPPARGDAALLEERPAGRLHPDHRPDRGRARSTPSPGSPTGRASTSCPASSRRTPSPRRASSRPSSRSTERSRMSDAREISLRRPGAEPELRLRRPDRPGHARARRGDEAEPGRGSSRSSPSSRSARWPGPAGPLDR